LGVQHAIVRGAAISHFRSGHYHPLLALPLKARFPKFFFFFVILLTNEGKGFTRMLNDALNLATRLRDHAIGFTCNLISGPISWHISDSCRGGYVFDIPSSSCKLGNQGKNPEAKPVETMLGQVIELYKIWVHH
jgi:hypothetical protein